MVQTLEKKWVKKEFKTEQLNALLESPLGLSIPVAKLLLSLGLETPEQARKFLKPNFKTELHDPTQLKNSDKFIQRIQQAIKNNEKVLVHGDYDADGVTTTGVYVKGFSLLNFSVDYFVPNRFTDGYGVNPKNVEKFSAYDLIITGDTGIKDYEAIAHLTHETKTDVIVTDHHEPLVYPLEEKFRLPSNAETIVTETKAMAIPDCYAVIDPKRIDDEYPSKDLSGAGVAFKLMVALFDALGQHKKELYYLTDFVATGLVPDMVPLFDVKRDSFEVRNLVKIGLSMMNKHPKRWVQTVEAQKKKAKIITSTNLGFGYGPLLNAVGRLKDPTPAVEFLLEEDPQKSEKLYQYLHEVNVERRKITEEMTKKILQELELLPKERVEYGIVVFSKDLHVGITGLVAGKILETYYRPTIALSEIKKEDGSVIYKGSARSIEGISVLDALIETEKEIGSYIYGGHEQAAGVTLLPEQLEPFIVSFAKQCEKQARTQGAEEVFHPKTYYDLELSFEDITPLFLHQLSFFEPYGMGNPEPTFYAKDVQIKQIKTLSGNENWKSILFSQQGKLLNGITFNRGMEIQEWVDHRKNLEQTCEILFFPTINDFNGEVQLHIQDIR